MKKIIFIVILVVSGLSVSAQDFTFSQFFASPTYVNPAFAGSTGSSRVALNYRNHVPALQTKFITYAAYYDQYIDLLKGGLGGHFFYDQAGDFNQINIGLMNSFTVKLNRQYYFKSGFQYDIFQSRLNGGNLVFEDPNETISASASKLKFDFSAGFMFYDDSKFLGIKIAHLLEPNLSIEGSTGKSYNLKRAFSIHGGWTIPVEYYKFRPYKMSYTPVIVYFRQGNSNLLMFGTTFNFLQYSIGTFIRNNLNLQPNALVFLLGIKLTSYKFAYSYDWNLSAYHYSNFGAHEISFMYIFETKDAKRKYKAIKCPSF